MHLFGKLSGITTGKVKELLWELFGQGRKEETKAKSGLMKEYRLLGDRTDWSMGEEMIPEARRLALLRHAY